MTTQAELFTYQQALEQAARATSAMWATVTESQYEIASGLLSILLGTGDMLDAPFRRKLERKYPTKEDKIEAIQKGGKAVAKKGQSLISKRVADRTVDKDDVQPLISAHLEIFGETIR